MRIVAALLISLSLISMPLVPVSAAADKTLANLKGDVSYQTANGLTTTPVAPKSSIALQDSYTAVTGARSEGAIGLPDSSQVLVGANTRVTLSKFEQSDIAHASFVVVGKVRFAVKHPNGAKADYTFTTGTSQVAVRGTEGDISYDPTTGNLQVNCYELSDPTLPIQITLASGQVYTLAAGQSLLLTFPAGAAGAPSAQVTNITRQLANNFSEFGTAPNASALGLITKPWFLATGWIIALPILAIIATNHPVSTNTPAPPGPPEPPSGGQFPVGVNIVFKH